MDGVTYNSAVTFSWPEGSEHVLVFITDPPLTSGTTNPLQTDGSTQYSFAGWEDNNGLVQPTTVPVQVVTANPAITSFTANVTVAYLLSLNFFTAGNPGQSVVPPTCGAPGAIPPGQSRPGVVYIGLTCFWSSVALFVPAGTIENLNAYPYPGFAFEGWSIDGSTPTSFLTTVTMSTPRSITPIFVTGKLVSFLTSPLGLQVLIDHTPVPTRTVSDVPGCPNNETLPLPVQLGFPSICFGDFYFVPGSTHFISGVTPQRDNTGNWWVFSAWSNGLAAELAVHGGQQSECVGCLDRGLRAGGASGVPDIARRVCISPWMATPTTRRTILFGDIGTTHKWRPRQRRRRSNGRVYTFQNGPTRRPRRKPSR